jgi:hypothetical protein
LFDFHQADANSVSNRGLYHPMINLKTEINEKSIVVNAYSFSQSVKLMLNLKKDFFIYCEELLNLKKEKTKNIQE